MQTKKKKKKVSPDRDLQDKGAGKSSRKQRRGYAKGRSGKLQRCPRQQLVSQTKGAGAWTWTMAKVTQLAMVMHISTERTNRLDNF